MAISYLPNRFAGPPGRHSYCSRAVAAARIAAAAFALATAVSEATDLNAPRPTADPRRVEPTFWRERLFFIPYQPDPHQFLAGSTREVRLYISRDGVTWAMLQQARPEVRGFSYHAPGDGEYYFAVQVVDASGRATPQTVVDPQLRVVVDSSRPEIALQVETAAAGGAVLRYDVRDMQLAPATLQIEVRESSGPWRSVQVGPPDTQRPDRLAGRVTWGPATSNAALAFRAAVSDRAGNTATAEAKGAAVQESQRFAHPARPAAPTRSTSPAHSPSAESMEGPALGPAANLESLPSYTTPSLLARPDAYATGAVAGARSLEWPASNGPAQDDAPSAMLGDSLAGSASGSLAKSEVANRPPPPLDNPYAPAGYPVDDAIRPDDRVATPPVGSAFVNGRNGRTVFAGDPFAASDETIIDEAASRPRAAPTLSSEMASPFMTAGASSSAASDAASTGATWTAGGAGPGGELPPGAMMVNSRTFDVEYDVSTVGDWGVARVELWGTADNGATWSSFAVDPDSRSPVRVTTPGAGLFGMRIVVHGANAATAPPPAAGVPPEMFVYVDLYPPSVNLLGAERGEGDRGDQLRIRWAASDAHLADGPITILYSSYESGPWSTAAANLENTGEFHWRLQRHLPERLFLRIEATDEAGNVGSAASRQPVHLTAPRPTGRLRGVRPSTAASSTMTSPFGQ